MLELKENITGQKAIYKTLLNISKQDENLIFEFCASNCSFNSYSDKYNDPIYNGDVVEVFIDLKKKNHYLEVEVAPNGTLFIYDIKNINGDFTGSPLKNEGISTKIQKNNKDLIVKLIINCKYFGFSDNPKFNAYRIETDGINSNRHLFALSPTLCGSFHKHKKFVPLNEYID